MEVAFCVVHKGSTQVSTIYRGVDWGRVFYYFQSTVFFLVLEKGVDLNEEPLCFENYIGRMTLFEVI